MQSAMLPQLVCHLGVIWCVLCDGVCAYSYFVIGSGELDSKKDLVKSLLLTWSKSQTVTPRASNAFGSAGETPSVCFSFTCALLALSQTLLCGAGNAKEVEQCGAAQWSSEAQPWTCRTQTGRWSHWTGQPRAGAKRQTSKGRSSKDEPPATRAGWECRPLRLELRKESAFVITSHGPWPRFS